MGFQLMQILGLLGMYFDAVVVEVKTFYFYSDWLWPYSAELGSYSKSSSTSSTTARTFQGVENLFQQILQKFVIPA